MQNDSFWVCEKSDGVRVLVMIVCLPEGAQEVYLVRVLRHTSQSGRIGAHTGAAAAD